MKLILRYLLFTFLLLGITGISPAFSQTENKAPSASKTTSNPPIFINIPDPNTQPALDRLIKKLRNINKNLQSLNRSQNRNAFKDLLTQAQDISSESTRLINMLKPRVTGYDQAIKLMETVSGEKDKSENSNFNDYYKSIVKNKNDLNAQIQQATIIQLEANSQVFQIQQSLSNIQQVQLLTHNPSPLTYNFWRQINLTSASDQKRMSGLYNDFIGLFTNAWNTKDNGRLLLFVGIISTILMVFVVRAVIEKVIARIVEKIIPPTRLRRSIMTLFSAILCSFIAGISATILLTCLDYQDSASHPAFDFSQNIIHQLYFCGFILGLYRGFLAVQKPQWRLLPISDKTAQAINILPNIYALMIFLLGIVKYINTTSGVSILAQQLCNGFFTCIACILFLMIPIRLRKIGQQKLSTQTDKGPDISFILIAVGLPVFCIICIAAVLSGYIYLGFSMCVWLNWVILVFSTLSLLRMLLNDITALILDPDRWLGKKLQLIGIRAQRMDQLSIVITGFITLLTIILMIASVASPGNFDLLSFVDHLTSTLQNQKIGNISISFSTILEALFVFLIGIYCVRLIRNWLNSKLFPKTNLDNATRNSIDTIFNYFCWVLIAMVVLSILGVTTQNITWIVSALSVGIGFGLQAIVQNFVSGLILLAERPVRIGDTVTIGGVKGTVMSIKVRATEIQLSDFSTLIVPNSQLITSSVQNATRSRHLGLISLKLPVISVKQLEASRQLIIDIMNNHPEVVDPPAPKVLVDSITETSLVISITCYVGHSSSTDGVKSEILSEYLAKIGILASSNYAIKSTDKESLASENE
ncbi:mechanosensitive ion channel family protein [Commensalibacter oyaizuii]|uniref:Mechanosensitive ion channel n=1 Tax=Commensalibacter oyaizuii TaxID=3043873 RepID=A0ABT6Q2W3_9PROT|nr:mechanosensitive ion channel domain-containing protein [Commensalibacter sp. TBRC 16381]MDI2091360.1 mechanosensitive ion channel [Commensalibacter sp. TBRC 16381]